jgi:thioesterase domain-containing protein
MLPHLGPYISEYLDLRSVPSHPKQAEQQRSWFFRKLSVHFQAAKPDGQANLPKLKRSELKRLFQVFQANVRADSHYRPQQYPGQVTLFKTAHQDSTWGWGDIAAEGVELHQIPGHHMNVLRPPQVQDLAEKLSACLSQPDEVIIRYPRH